jgi:hypothetical protein
VAIITIRDQENPGGPGKLELFEKKSPSAKFKAFPPG